MEMQELEITIDRNGRVHVAVRGVPGEGCLALTRELENAIGMVEERGYTAEYYKQPVEISGYQYQDRQ
ncbi:DUF2997 domain-containing protein [uncultured Methanoregula sp.]|uniref:DUF2997 domain-containing protein n=1 Tax=uncultured Methanoregula sp. TaxID=1005933 RepID=UPI002AAA775F|nr:DUF2997 domain-containing protein [uncultured Methanoregula sp.]